MEAQGRPANFFIHVPRLKGVADIVTVESRDVKQQNVQVLVDRVKKRVARKPAEYGSVVDAVEVRFQDNSESIEFEEDVSLALLHFQLSPDGGLIKDAKAWPQIWAVMEESSGTGASVLHEPARVDATKETAPKGTDNSSAPSQARQPASSQLPDPNGSFVPTTPGFPVQAAQTPAQGGAPQGTAQRMGGRHLAPPEALQPAAGQDRVRQGLPPADAANFPPTDDIRNTPLARAWAAAGNEFERQRGTNQSASAAHGSFDPLELSLGRSHAHAFSARFDGCVRSGAANRAPVGEQQQGATGHVARSQLPNGVDQTSVGGDQTSPQPQIRVEPNQVSESVENEALEGASRLPSPVMQTALERTRGLQAPLVTPSEARAQVRSAPFTNAPITPAVLNFDEEEPVHTVERLGVQPGAREGIHTRGREGNEDAWGSDLPDLDAGANGERRNVIEPGGAAGKKGVRCWPGKRGRRTVAGSQENGQVEENGQLNVNGQSEEIGQSEGEEARRLPKRQAVVQDNNAVAATGAKGRRQSDGGKGKQASKGKEAVPGGDAEQRAKIGGQTGRRRKGGSDGRGGEHTEGAEASQDDGRQAGDAAEVHRSKRRARVFGNSSGECSYRAANKGKGAAPSRVQACDAGPSGADIGGAHYKKVVRAAGCAQAISELRTTCVRAPRKTVLYRREDDKEVKVGTFDSVTAALEAAQDHDIIEQSGEADQAWFSLNKPITLRGNAKHPAHLCSKWSVYPCIGAAEAFKPLIEIQRSAKGLRLGPNIVITSSTDKQHGAQTTAVFVRDGAHDIVFDHVTISGDAKRKNKTSNEDTERPGGFGVIFGQNTSGEMRHCRVVHHELSGIQARAGAVLRLENCDVSSNGDTAIWALGSSGMTIDHCTVRSNGQDGICIDGPPSSISNCRISNNYLDGLWLDWPNKTRLKGSDQMAAKKPICRKGHSVRNNYIAENDYGITVEEGVAVNMDGNVVEKNKLVGVYFDEEKRAEGAPPTDYPCDLRSCCSTVLPNNIIRNNHESNFEVDAGRVLPTHHPFASL